MSLPVASPWYGTQRIDDRIRCLTEPHVHPIFSANIFLVLGRDADLVIDAGMGIAPLKPAVDALRPDPAKPLTLFLTHTHVDHIGAAHEFDARLVHPLEAAELDAPAHWTLSSDDIDPVFRALFLEAGYDPLWPLLVDAVPEEGYDPSAYDLRPAPATGRVEDGDVIDLGDWQAEVIHMPGHSPGQVGLWHEGSRTLFGADAIYDGPLIYTGPGMSTEAYAETFRRIRDLPVERVLGGHDPAFGRQRFDEIIERHLALWA